MQLIALFLSTHFIHKLLCLPFIRTPLLLRVTALLWVLVLSSLSFQEPHTEDIDWACSRKSQPVNYTPFSSQMKRSSILNLTTSKEARLYLSHLLPNYYLPLEIDLPSSALTPPVYSARSQPLQPAQAE